MNDQKNNQWIVALCMREPDFCCHWLLMVHPDGLWQCQKCFILSTCQVICEDQIWCHLQVCYCWRPSVYGDTADTAIVCIWLCTWFYHSLTFSNNLLLLKVQINITKTLVISGKNNRNMVEQQACGPFIVIWGRLLTCFYPISHSRQIDDTDLHLYVQPASGQLHCPLLFQEVCMSHSLTVRVSNEAAYQSMYHYMGLRWSFWSFKDPGKHISEDLTLLKARQRYWHLKYQRKFKKSAQSCK